MLVSCLATTQVVAVVTGFENLFQKVASGSTFSDKICTCCAFYRPKANLFCSKSRVWRDARVILLNRNSEVSIHATCKNLTCGKTGLIRG